MDQEKIGKFIAEMRKQHNLTQRAFADALGISDKTVSKWECGNGMPELSLMQPICKILEINLNELFSGERLTDADYKKKAEENMLSLIKEAENKKRILLAAKFWVMRSMLIRMLVKHIKQILSFGIQLATNF